MLYIWLLSVTTLYWINCITEYWYVYKIHLLVQCALVLLYANKYYWPECEAASQQRVDQYMSVIGLQLGREQQL